MALVEATTHPKRSQDNTGLDIYGLVTTAGEIVQGVALIGPDEAQLSQFVDEAFVPGDPGFPLLAVRKDLATALAGTDGDYIPLTVDAEGQLYVRPGAPDITPIAGTKSASGDNTLIDAPGAGSRLVISGIVIQNEGSAPLTMLLKDGAATKRRYLGYNQGDGLSQIFPSGKEWRLSENSALVINLSDTLAAGYTIDYWVEAMP